MTDIVEKVRQSLREHERIMDALRQAQGKPVSTVERRAVLAMQGKPLGADEEARAEDAG